MPGVGELADAGRFPRDTDERVGVDRFGDGCTGGAAGGASGACFGGGGGTARGVGASGGTDCDGVGCREMGCGGGASGGMDCDDELADGDLGVTGGVFSLLVELSMKSPFEKSARRRTAAASVVSTAH